MKLFGQARSKFHRNRRSCTTRLDFDNLHGPRDGPPPATPFRMAQTQAPRSLVLGNGGAAPRSSAPLPADLIWRPRVRAPPFGLRRWISWNMIGTITKTDKLFQSLGTTDKLQSWLPNHSSMIYQFMIPNEHSMNHHYLSSCHLETNYSPSPHLMDQPIYLLYVLVFLPAYAASYLAIRMYFAWNT